MRKPSARIVVAALAIPAFGGFATYAAAQVSTRPAPQVVIPAALTSSVAKTHSSASSSPKTSSTVPGHDANDDHGHDGVNTSSTVPGHDVNDDHGNDGVNTSSTVPGHDANDDHGRDGANTSSTVPGHDANDDHGHDAVTSTSVPQATTPKTATPKTTPTTVDDHGGDNGNRGKGGGGHDD